MSESQNIQIPTTLFKRIIALFEYLDISGHTLSNIYDYRSVLLELREKQHSINLRSAYTKILYAKNDAQRNAAQAAYLKLKYKRSDFNGKDANF